MSETKGHDDLCPTGQNEDPNCWFCEHNAKVRADERAKTLNDPGYERRDRRIEAEVRERIAQYVRGSTEFWDALATEIRRVDGNHTLGAAAMAEELVPFIAAIAREEKP